MMYVDQDYEVLHKILLKPARITAQNIERTITITGPSSFYVGIIMHVQMSQYI